MEELGGYLGEGTIGPESLSQIISKIAQKGPTPLIGTYFDLSYGRNPQVMLIIDQPTNAAPVLEVEQNNLIERIKLSGRSFAELHPLDGTKDTAAVQKQSDRARATRRTAGRLLAFFSLYGVQTRRAKRNRQLYKRIECGECGG